MIEDGPLEEASVKDGDDDEISLNVSLHEQVSRLRAIVDDLNRRIQNSHYIIESEKKVRKSRYCISHF